MIKFIISLIILTLLITYAISPGMKFLRRFASAEKKRLDKYFSEDDKS